MIFLKLMGSAIEYVVNCSCIPNKSIYPTPYTLKFDAQELQKENKTLFQSNFVKTSRYSLLTFLPKALLLQFKRLANVYFLIISILLSIPVISPVNPLTAWAPLLIVIGISIIREGFEDYQRYKSDLKMNYETNARVIRDGKLQELQWSQILVGDIVQVQNQEFFPTDLLLLASSTEGGTAYIETASLDGQKNLKIRNAYTNLSKYITDIMKIKGDFESGPPDKDLHKFKGKLRIANQAQIQINGEKQLLYRGTRLKNTKFIYGLTIYTGKNTKIMLNSESESEKMSQIQVKVNYILGIILIVQIVLCVVCAVCYACYRYTYQNGYYYVNWPSFGVPLDSFLIFLTYFVLLNTMIPISLIVSIEMVKLSQKYFLQRDQLMFSEYRKLGVTVKTSALNEELGQIQYVFTDKTGTLTMNIMEFKIALIGEMLFGATEMLSQRRGTMNKPRYHGFRDDKLKELLDKGTNNMPLSRPLCIYSKDKKQSVQFNTLRELAEQYFIALSLAHQVMPQTNKKGEKIYQGQSPDQIALVDAARGLEYEFMRSTQSNTYIRIRGREVRYELLELFPFSSDRKMMSIIVKDKDGVIKMYTKGADGFVKKKLAQNQKLNVDQELNRFSVIGLRTLMLAMRVITKQELEEFRREVSRLPNVDSQKKLQQLRSKMENNLYVIGATAVLDRLQDDVPQTIRDLIRANIKVWMLTGDKMETAENIAKSCKLIQPNFNVMKYNLSEFSLRKTSQLRYRYGVYKVSIKTRYRYASKSPIMMYLEELVAQSQRLRDLGVSKAFLIQGDDLTEILKEDTLKKQLSKIAGICEAVVCCRLLPLQKAEVVELVRKYLDKITLAIGDGANDVPMIKTAHIGIGLFGQQGNGAVQASDYALPQFRMLWRLLFVHGRWNYIRISQMILYFFYKNMLFTIPQFIAAFYCFFSGQTIFDDIYITLYNLLFTAIPLLIRAVLEQDVNYVYKKKDIEENEQQLTGKSLLMQAGYLPEKYHFIQFRYGISKYFYRLFPKIYFIGQENCIFNSKNFMLWLIEGVVQAVLISLFAFYIIGSISLNEHGYSSDYKVVGLTIYSTVILVVTFKLATHTRFWSICLFFSITLLSLGLYVAYMWISNYALSFTMEGTTYEAWTSAQTYFLVLFCVALVLCVDGMVVFMDFRKGSYASKMRQVVHEQQINNREYYDEISLTITEGLTKND